MQKQNFLDAQDFLSELLKLNVSTKPYGYTPNQYMADRNKDNLQGIRDFGKEFLSKDYNQREIENLQPILDLHLMALYEVLEESVLKKVKAEVAFGLADNLSFGAYCYKAPNQDLYAILIYQGLFHFLNRYSKLIYASQYPSLVEFCSEGDPKTLQPKDYIYMASQMIPAFHKLNLPHGGLIVLKGEAAEFQSRQLLLMEAFIIAHELGHYLNDDFKNKNNFSLHPNFPFFYFFLDNKDHKQEYKADITGFKIYEKHARAMYPLIKREYCLFAVMGLFTMIYHLYGSFSNTHPSPFNRVINIAYKLFNKKFARLVEQAYEDANAYLELYNMFNP